MFFKDSRAAKTVLPAAALATSASLLFATPALADTNSNVVPGADQDSVVVHTDTNLLSITVPAADAAATHISGTVNNGSDKTFTCAGPRAKDDIAGDVTTSQLVAKSVDYYRKNTFRELPKVPLEFGNIPLIGPIKLGEIDLGMLSPLLQGLGGLLGDANAERNQIASDYSDARVKGHAGLIQKFTIAPNSSHDFSVYLNVPSSGPRTDFDAAAFIMCTDEAGAAYAFAGYEEGTRKPSDAFFGWPSSPSLPSPNLDSPGLNSPSLNNPSLPNPGAGTDAPAAPAAPTGEATPAVADAAAE